MNTMPLTKTPRPKLKFHPQAYMFLTDALSEAQVAFGRDKRSEASGHISARELLDGFRSLAQRRFGMMANTVFQSWGISTTADVGKIVFELIELGKMKKTESDQFSDFVDVYSFEQAFGTDYAIDISKAFKS